MKDHAAALRRRASFDEVPEGETAVGGPLLISCSFEGPTGGAGAGFVFGSFSLTPAVRLESESINVGQKLELLLVR